MIDLHCHVLPGVDDGPPTLEGALALARTAAAAGTRTIVATPHVNWTFPHVDADLVESGVVELNAALQAEGVPLEVLGGAEVAHTRAFDLDDDELARLRLGGGRWLLLECPLSTSAGGFDAAAGELAGRGHRVLLAHPERSPAFQRDPGLLERLVGAGMLAQVTAGALTGDFGRIARTTARDMLARGLVANVASDAHSAGPDRSPALRTALATAGLSDVEVDHLAQAVPRALLQGVPLPPTPPLSRGSRPGGVVRRLLRRAS